MVRHRRSTLACVFATLVLTAGCAGDAPTSTPSPTPTPTPSSTTTPSPTPTATPSPTPLPGLDPVLVGLVRAENRTAFAERNDLELRDGSVLVVAELHDGASFPDEYATEVVGRQSGQAVAYVPVDSLRALSRHENVRYVRPPRAAMPT